MKTSKLIKRIRDLLNADRREQLQERDSLKKLLKKLRKRRKALQLELESATDPAEIRRIEEAMLILKTQRKKGIALLQELSEES